MEPQIGTIDSHYVQKARLKQFSWTEGKHHKLVVVDLARKKIGSRNIESAFYQNGLYSDEVEKEMNEKVETPGMRVFGKAYNSDNVVMLTRDELETMKKYLLVQLYRNPSNMSHYSPNWEGDILGVNKQFKNDAEAYQHVCDEIHAICSSSWNELMSTEDKELWVNIWNIRQVSTLFVRSQSLEFVINDLGSVCERQEYHGLKRDILKMTMKEALGREITDETADEIIKQHQYYDNFTFYPITSHFGIITLSPVWASLIKSKQPYEMVYRGPNSKIRVDVDYSFYDWVEQTMGLHSDFIRQLYIPCTNIYESPELRKADFKNMNPLEINALFEKYSSPNDKYLYPVVDLSIEWAEYLNRLTINEAKKYFAFGSIRDGQISISNYDMVSTINTKAKNDLSWIDWDADWKKPLD